MLSMYEKERGYTNDKQREAAQRLTLDQNEYYNECLDQLRENVRTRRFKDESYDCSKREFQLELLSRWQAAQAMRHPDIRWGEQPEELIEPLVIMNEKPVWMSDEPETEQATPKGTLEDLVSQLHQSIKLETEKREKETGEKFKAPF